MEWIHGEFTGDGIAQFADFLLQADNFGKTAAAAPVPEPSAAMLMICSVSALMFWRRRP